MYKNAERHTGTTSVKVSLTLIACVVVGSVALSSRALAQESSGVVVSLERLALRAAIDRAVGQTAPGFRIVIDPMIVHANEAPGGRDSVTRDRPRNSELVRGFSASTLARKSVIDCTVRPCKLRNADLFVTLSQPSIRGDSAKVTVTTVQQTKRGVQYKTVNVLLKKLGNEWQVARFEDLGIS